MRRLLVIVAIVVLAACGGGGGSSAPPAGPSGNGLTAPSGFRVTLQKVNLTSNEVAVTWTGSGSTYRVFAGSTPGGADKLLWKCRDRRTTGSRRAKRRSTTCAWPPSAARTRARRRGRSRSSRWTCAMRLTRSTLAAGRWRTFLRTRSSIPQPRSGRMVRSSGFSYRPRPGSRRERWRRPLPVTTPRSPAAPFAQRRRSSPRTFKRRRFQTWLRSQLRMRILQGVCSQPGVIACANYGPVPIGPNKSFVNMNGPGGYIATAHELGHAYGLHHVHVNTSARAELNFLMNPVLLEPTDAADRAREERDRRRACRRHSWRHDAQSGARCGSGPAVHAARRRFSASAADRAISLRV